MSHPGNVEHYKSMKKMEVVVQRSYMSMIPYILLSMAIKIFILEPRVSFLKHYPYFNTPLIDLRQVFEAISNY